MTAIDFAAFVDALAAAAAEATLPFFRTALGVENKSSALGFIRVSIMSAAIRNSKPSKR